MVMTHESVEYLLANGQDLLQNANTPEAEKNKVRKDIANLVEQWESLSNTVNNRMQRYCDMSRNTSPLSVVQSKAHKTYIWISHLLKRYKQNSSFRKVYGDFV